MRWRASVYLRNGMQVASSEVQVATQATLTNATDDEELTVSFGIQNGEAVAKTMTIDYILAAVER